MTVVISGRIGFLGGKQGRIYGNPVADGWAGAIMQKSLAILGCYGPTDRGTDGRTDRYGKVLSRACATKKQTNTE